MKRLGVPARTMPRGGVGVAHVATTARRRVGAGARAPADLESSGRWRTTARRSSTMFRGHLVDSVDRSAQERVAAAPTAVRQRGGAGCAIGRRTEHCSRCGARSCLRCSTPTSYAGTSASPTAASPRRKRGARGRENQAGQGHEVDGGGRWRAQRDDFRPPEGQGSRLVEHDRVGVPEDFDRDPTLDD